MKTIAKNWKTSMAGGGMLSIGVTMLVNDPTQWKAALPFIGIGIIGLLAKDGNVTGTAK